MLLLVALRTVLPVFLLIAGGFALNASHQISDKTVSECNTLSFRLFLPCQIFKTVFEADLSTGFSFCLAIFAAAGVTVLFLLSLLIGSSEKEMSKCGVLEQGIFRANFVLLGIPMLSALYDPSTLGSIPLMIAVIVPLFNVYSVIVLEKNRAGAGKPSFLRLAVGIAKNPLIIGSLLGLAAKLAGLPLYRSDVLRQVLAYLAQLATPLTLLVLGASLRPASIRDNWRQVLICTLMRLIVAPMLAILIGGALGFRGQEIALLLVVFATPTAANSYTMAVQYDGDSDLAANLVVYTTVLSCITLFFWILLLQMIGWL